MNKELINAYAHGLTDAMVQIMGENSPFPEFREKAIALGLTMEEGIQAFICLFLQDGNNVSNPLRKAIIEESMKKIA